MIKAIFAKSFRLRPEKIFQFDAIMLSCETIVLCLVFLQIFFIVGTFEDSEEYI